MRESNHKSLPQFVGVVMLLIKKKHKNDVMLLNITLVTPFFFLSYSSCTTKKTKISEGYLVRENVKSLSNSVTKFCD